MEMTICLGPICSGKTTWSNGFIANHPDWYRFSIDDYKIMTSGYLSNDDLVYRMAQKCLEDMIYLMIPDKNIIIDGYFLDIERLRRMANYCEKITIIIFEAKLSDCMSRNIKRSTTKMKINQVSVVDFHKKCSKFFKSKEFKDFIINDHINLCIVNSEKIVTDVNELVF